MEDKTVTLIKELRELVTQEHYSRALALFDKEGEEILEHLPASAARNELLLLAAKINNGNTLPKKTENYLERLERENPDIENDFDYVEQKINVLLLLGNYDECSRFIDRCRKKKWSESQSTFLDYITGNIAFWNGDYSKATRLLDKSLDNELSSGDDFLSGCSSYLMGYIAFYRCFFDTAETHYRKALESFTRCGKRLSQGHTYKMLALLARGGGVARKRDLPECVNNFETTLFLI